MADLRVVVADDSVLLREGLVRVLGESGVLVVASYPDADQLLAALETDAPDLIVLDVRMPPTFRDEGVRAAIRARELKPAVGILLLSQYVEVAYAQELLSAGTGGVGVPAEGSGRIPCRADGCDRPDRERRHRA